MTGHRFDPTILREYDIRGVVGRTLDAADAEAIGRAFGTMVAAKGGKTVSVGYDGRLSSPELEAATVKGLLACGLSVLRIGLGPTPMMYFAVNTLPADGGIMISGSHNPPEYNGFKMMMGKGPFYGRDIQHLGEIAAKAGYATGKGAAADRAVLDAYVARLVGDYRGGRALKVAWDAGNGSAGEAMRRLTEKLPGTHILLNEKNDGTFPAPHPDPNTPQGLAQLHATGRPEK